MSGSPERHERERPAQRQQRERTARRQGQAYSGAFEAVSAILIGALLGYWADESFETSPVGLLVGVVLGFAAFVLRLVRLGRSLHESGERENEP